MRAHFILFLLALSCIAAPIALIEPCRMSINEVSEAEIGLDTMLIGVSDEPFPFSEVSESNMHAGCRCNEKIVYGESTKTYVKTFERCYDERWMLLSEIADRLKER